MKKKIGLGMIAALMLALVAWAFMPSPKEVEVAAVTQSKFERSVQEDGKTRVRDRYVVSTPLTGRLARIQLKQGDAVAVNDSVATLWPAVPALLDERTRAEQVAHMAAMQASVEKSQANAERASAALAQAREELKRSEALAQQGFVSLNQNETGRLNVQLREKELMSAQQEANVARFTWEQSRIALRQFYYPPQNRGLRSFEIKAPVSAKVLKVSQQSESLVMAGTPVMELGDPTQLEVVVDILTEDAIQIQPGTQVQLTHWGGPVVLLGQVRLIEPAAFTKVSALGVEEQRVNAVIDITSPANQWPTLGDGFKVDVRVLVQVVENVVKVPVSAIFPMGARSGIFVLADGRARLREIEVNARNGVEAWVKTDLAVGTQVIVYPDSKLKDKDRVRAH
jgi:HlyD family secretion protein